MSNIYARYVKFVELNESGDKVGESYGFTVFDDWGNAPKLYDRGWRSFTDLRAEINDGTILDAIKDRACSEGEDLYDRILANGGLDFYGWVSTEEDDAHSLG